MPDQEDQEKNQVVKNPETPSAPEPSVPESAFPGAIQPYLTTLLELDALRSMLSIPVQKPARPGADKADGAPEA